MLPFRIKLDTRSLFFGFIAGFCAYLFFSHTLLFGRVTPHSNTHTRTNSAFPLNQILKTNHFGLNQILKIVPWTQYNDIESLVNSEIFPPEQNKPPKIDNVDKSKLIQLEKARNSGNFYGGGSKDDQHLGGWKYNDSDTYERELWDWIIDTFNVSSVMDVGCGIGCSTIYFRKHKSVKDVLCVEGSLDGIKNSLVPDISVHHDYTLGPYWPNRVYDMVWSAEFLEHVHEQYIENVLATFKAAKIIFVTHSEWGGWHHANVHKSEWWIYKFESYGFKYMDMITEKAREQCPLLGVDFKYGPDSWHDLNPNDGNRKNSHFHFRGLVFFNQLYMNKLTGYDKKVLELLAKQ